MKMNDDELNTIIHSASEIIMEDFNTLELIKNLIKANPVLAIKLGKTALRNLTSLF
jgi:digeranylgeranylglycerophospholipid reductase